MVMFVPFRMAKCSFSFVLEMATPTDTLSLEDFKKLATKDTVGTANYDRILNVKEACCVDTIYNIEERQIMDTMYGSKLILNLSEPGGRKFKVWAFPRLTKHFAEPKEKNGPLVMKPNCGKKVMFEQLEPQYIFYVL